MTRLFFQEVSPTETMSGLERYGQNGPSLNWGRTWRRLCLIIVPSLVSAMVSRCLSKQDCFRDLRGSALHLRLRWPPIFRRVTTAGGSTSNTTTRENASSRPKYRSGRQSVFLSHTPREGSFSKTIKDNTTCRSSCRMINLCSATAKRTENMPKDPILPTRTVHSMTLQASVTPKEPFLV